MANACDIYGYTSVFIRSFSHSFHNVVISLPEAREATNERMLTFESQKACGSRLVVGGMVMTANGKSMNMVLWSTPSAALSIC